MEESEGRHECRPRRISQNRPKRALPRSGCVSSAIKAAEKVRRWGDVVELEPLNAFDRRIVHQALKDDPRVETQSVEVEGSDKKAILLRPKS